jgi:L-ascorbate metabolism protein UlaG (beta-lactamase superfamily)
MELRKFGHSCVRLDDGDRSLVLDPGVFSDADAALDGAAAVLITHEHPDHVDIDRLRTAAQRDSRLQIFAPAPVATALLDLGEQVVSSAAGHTFTAADFPVRTFGGQHAVIHPTIPLVPNVAYLIADRVYHPGDSFTVPSAPVDVLLAPVYAPWSKIAEVIDFVVAVRAPRTVGIHDSQLSDVGLSLIEGHVTRIGGDYGVEYRRLVADDVLAV